MRILQAVPPSSTKVRLTHLQKPYFSSEFPMSTSCQQARLIGHMICLVSEVGTLVLQMSARFDAPFSEDCVCRTFSFTELFKRLIFLTVWSGSRKVEHPVLPSPEENQWELIAGVRLTQVNKAGKMLLHRNLPCITGRMVKLQTSQQALRA